MSVLGAGFYGPTEGEKKRRAVADAARRMAEVIEELPNTSDEEKATLKKDSVGALGFGGDLRNIGVNALSTVDHDYCDACGKFTVVTDVWIDHHDAKTLLGVPTYVRHDVRARHYPEAVGDYESRGYDTAVVR